MPPDPAPPLEAPTRLLRADEEELALAAVVLSRGRPSLVIVAAPRPLWEAASASLARQAKALVAEPIVLATPDEVLGALESLSGVERGRVTSFALQGDTTECLRALNWHREKLLSGGSVLLWLDGLDALRLAREIAPDAYSFRERVVLLRGAPPPLEGRPGKESPRLREARNRLARARTPLDRASASSFLSQELRHRLELDEAETVALAGLKRIPKDKYRDDRTREIRAFAYGELAAVAYLRGKLREESRWNREGLQELEGLDTRNARSNRVELNANTPGPHGGYDQVASERALLLAAAHSVGHEARTCALTASSQVALAHGRFSDASRYLEEQARVAVDPFERAHLIVNQAYLAEGKGQFRGAEAHCAEASKSFAALMHDTSQVSRELCDVLLARGEIASAEQVLATMPSSDPSHKHWSLAAVALLRGDVPAALARCREALQAATSTKADGAALAICGALAETAEIAHDAARLGRSEWEGVVADLEVAEDVLLSSDGDDLPAWYAIRFLKLRSDVLALEPDRLDDALGLGRKALDQARERYPDLVPEALRGLAEKLVHAGRADEALPLIEEADPVAVEKRNLRELTTVRALRVAALTMRRAPEEAIHEAMRRLRETLGATESPRIHAEALLRLSIDLGELCPDATLPDPLALLEEARALFLEMPMPAQAARCLETAGDVLFARGQGPEARRRYAMAHSKLASYELGLRLPRLEEKVAR